MNDFELFEKKKSVNEYILHLENELRNIQLKFEDIALRPIYAEVFTLSEERDNVEKELRIARIERTKLEKDASYEQKLFNLFSIFKKHSNFLKEKGYYKIDGKYLCWDRDHGGNLLLAGYFGGIQDVPGNKRNIWAPIEKAFNTRNLAQQYSDYEKISKGKTAKYDQYDKELRSLIDGKISL